MGCEQSTTLQYHRASDTSTPREFRSYKCGNCNLLQRRSRTNRQPCLGCGADPVENFCRIDIERVVQDTVGSRAFDSVARRAINFGSRQQCTVCQALQYTTYDTCQFCLVEELMSNGVSRSSNLRIFHDLQFYAGSDSIAVESFLTQQRNRIIAGELWLLNRINPLDPRTTPGVQLSMIRTSLVNTTQHSRQIAPSNYALQPKMKDFSKINTDDMIHQLSDLLDPSRHTVRKY